ncbi:MAG: gfo/Idh/MocA family oxidoreductase, partial [Verrucomicrobiota bacterium]
VSDPKLLEGQSYDPELYGTDPIKHVRNFLDCVKTREKPVCNSTVARYGHVAGHAAAISWKLGRKLQFDPKAEAFVGDDEANRMRSRARRAPWHV